MNELAISLDLKSGKPIYEQIYEFIKKEIQNGGLPFHKRLPSTRSLASFLQVSRSTVELAYEQLMSEGYIETIPCKGCYVSELDGLYRLQRNKGSRERVKPENGQKDYIYDFTPSGVDLHSFPYNTWRKLSKNVLLENHEDLFQLGDSRGEYRLRKTIADYLHQARGVNCRTAQIIVGAGNDYLCMLLTGILGGGRTIAMENPTYKKAYRVLAALSNEMCVVNMDRDGMDVEELEKSGASVAYVMPSHQFPLGTVMPVKRRMQLLSWASACEGRYIIEDDYDSEFRYKGRPIPALQGFDSEGRVIYIGTFSRSIAPAIRVSYMVLPETLLKIYEKQVSVFSSTVSKIDQMIISGFLTEGYFERHLNKMRALYKGRHDALIEEVKSFGADFGIDGENAGVHILLRIENGMNESTAIELAAKAGVRIYGLSSFYVAPSVKENPPTVILGYANLNEKEIRAAAVLLKEAWNIKRP